MGELMSKKGLFFCVALAAASTALAGAWKLGSPGDACKPVPVVSVARNADGVSLKMEPGILRLQVFSPEIVRVAYSRDGQIPAGSLAVIARPSNTEWSVEETGSEVVLSTKKIEVRVNRSSGAVAFFDAASGTPILREPAAGGKSMTPTEIAGHKTWICRQEFALADEEALYGLGQHQDGGMNYRGRKIRMIQSEPIMEFPGDTAVPFLVSSTGYGVLWDNPALAIVDMQAGSETAIPPAALSSRDGVPGGLEAEYYTGTNFSKKVKTQTDPTIDFDWKKAAPEGLPADRFSIRWEGLIQAPASGNHTLLLTSDDGVRMWVDDQLVIDSWVGRAETTDSAVVDFEKGSRHRIKIEYFENVGDAGINLKWILPGTSGRLAWTAEAGRAIDYYFVYGPELDGVVAGYRRLTGGVPMFGKWAWGFWQSKERYNTQQELIEVAKRYRKNGIPIDGIVQDWHYWPELDPETLEGGWGSHTFDPKRYPDFAKAVDELHRMHVRVLISVWPWFAMNDRNEGIPNLRALAKIGAIFPFPGKCWAGNMRWYDPFGAAARRLYWSQVDKGILSTGVDGLWLDSTEPEAGAKSAGQLREFDTLGGHGSELVNAYPLMQNTAVHDGLLRDAPTKRPFILTRSAYAGLQRCGAVVWSGDIQGTWKIFRKQIPVGLNFCLGGIPYWNTDIGGFFINQFKKGPADPAYAELFTRWFQFGAFCPMFRVHGTNHAKEMWRFPEATQPILEKFDRLRYHLLPYIYSVSWMVTDRDYTMMRPLVMDFRADSKVWNIPDQYMFGPAIMACPVTEPGAATRQVYLPKGSDWFDFWTGRGFRGGQAIVADAPIDKMPLFVRAGSILPYGPEIQYAAERADPIELRIYRGADGSFTLYEDEGENLDYRKGAFSTIRFDWNEKDGILTIGRREGGFPGMKTRRTFHIVWVESGHGAGVAQAARPDRTVAYTGKETRVRPGN